MKQLKIAVVVPVLSAFEEAVIALYHIKTKFLWTPFIAPQWKENKSISFCWNAYASEAFDRGYDYCLILNDDAYVFPWAIDSMIDELQSNDELHLVSGEDTHTEFDVHRAEVLQQSNLNYSCFMITPQLFELAGLFDENFYPAYFEDNDMHYRMRLLDMPSYGISTAQFFHVGSVTAKKRLKEQSDLASAQFAACKLYYNFKWGGQPGEETFIYPYNDSTLTPKDWRSEN